MLLVPLESAFNALSKDTLCKARACSQQKLQAHQCGDVFYCHVVYDTGGAFDLLAKQNEYNIMDATYTQVAVTAA